MLPNHEVNIFPPIRFPILIVWFRSIAEYLSRKDIRKIIGADPSLPENFAVSSMTVGLAFTATVDMAHRNDYYVSALLDRGVRALIYAGILQLPLEFFSSAYS